MTDAVPRVSVVIPCYNAATTLAATFRSVIAQTYDAYEVIAVDDGSTDSTLTLLREQEAAFGGRMRIVALEKNRGLPGARNAGIEIARGAYLAFLDADDEWHCDKTVRQVAYLDKHEEAVLVGCRAQELLDGVKPTIVNGNREPTIGPDAWRLLLHHSYFVPSMVMARASDTRAIGGFDTRRFVAEDQDFFTRIALRGSVGMVDDVLVTKAFSPTGLSNKNRLREPDGVLPMLHDLFALAGDRLSQADRRAIMGARLAYLGRAVYPHVPGQGSRLLLRAVCHGDAPFANLAYLITACPWLEPIKRIVRGPK